MGKADYSASTCEAERCSPDDILYCCESCTLNQSRTDTGNSGQRCRMVGDDGRSLDQCLDVDWIFLDLAVFRCLGSLPVMEYVDWFVVLGSRLVMNMVFLEERKSGEAQREKGMRGEEEETEGGIDE